MQANKINMFLIFSTVLLVVTFSGCTEKLNETVIKSNYVTGQINMESLNPLFSNYDLTLNTDIEGVSIHSLDGTELSVQEEVSPNATFSFQVPSGAAYFLKARTVEGVNLWAITPMISNDTVQDIDLNTTYEAALIVASLGKTPSSNVDDLKQKAAEALEWDFDRLVKTVKRVVHNAVLKQVDYPLVTEVNKETLRAFAGGIEPVRSLDSILNEPEYDYTPFIYAARYVSTKEPNNILITEIDAKRWDYRVQGISKIMKYPEIKTRKYPEGYESRTFSIEQNPHVINGGTTLLFNSNRLCLKEPYPCPYKYDSDRNTITTYTFDVIFTIPLDASADTSPTQLTPADENFKTLTPKWSWDEKKIVFGVIPGRQNHERAPGQIYVMNKDGTGITQLTVDKEPNVLNKFPAWSPDNKQIVYASTRTGDFELWIMNSDGSGNIQLTNSPDSVEAGPQFSPDGRQILFQSNRDGDFEIFIMNRDGSSVRQLTYNDVRDVDPTWAHNGLDIVYTSAGYIRSVFRLVALNTLTGETVHDFGDFATAKIYKDPVWAATNHFLVPSMKAIEKGEYTPDGYVTNTASVLVVRIATANPPVQSSYKTINKPKPKYTSKSNGGDWRSSLPDQGYDWTSTYRHEIASAHRGTLPYTPPIDWE